MGASAIKVEHLNHRIRQAHCPGQWSGGSFRRLGNEAFRPKADLLSKETRRDGRAFRFNSSVNFNGSLWT